MVKPEKRKKTRGGLFGSGYIPIVCYTDPSTTPGANVVVRFWVLGANAASGQTMHVVPDANFITAPFDWDASLTLETFTAQLVAKPGANPSLTVSASGFTIPNQPVPQIGITKPRRNSSDKD